MVATIKKKQMKGRPEWAVLVYVCTLHKSLYLNMTGFVATRTGTPVSSLPLSIQQIHTSAAKSLVLTPESKQITNNQAVYR